MRKKLIMDQIDRRMKKIAERHSLYLQKSRDGHKEDVKGCMLNDMSEIRILFKNVKVYWNPIKDHTEKEIR